MALEPPTEAAPAMPAVARGAEGMGRRVPRAKAAAATVAWANRAITPVAVAAVAIPSARRYRTDQRTSYSVSVGSQPRPQAHRLALCRAIEINARADESKV